MLTLVQLLHATYVAFIVTAPVFVLHASLAKAPWSRPLRWLHGGALAFIALQYALDWPCPLSLLENWLADRPLDETFLPTLQGAELVIGFAVFGYLTLSFVGHAAAHVPWKETA